MSEPNTDSPFMTTKELAVHVRRSVATVRGWRHRGTGPKGVKAGRGVLYRRDVVAAWLEAQEEADELARRAAA
ncbi:helix-turn-helix domain-containing protein [Streptomyces sp. ID05-04B]|uniref:helix-turn-helix transcriptional regulator n=1 Tax=unclassified Streptomyces TaxID=2593676 RepID=UPI0029C451DD|nr:helix-turn-helix domain-containing protein [Streptomyces sp. ID05-04B]MDX5570400.1 helix-turn-helix domain-containing protein [Streptomyces sp. ID05-04B]